MNENKSVRYNYEIRTLKREDMNAYTECMYSVYGDTYPNKIAYHPKVYMDAVENGRYYAAAAFSEGGGSSAFFRHPHYFCGMGYRAG